MEVGDGEGRLPEPVLPSVLATNTGIRILFANTIREYLNRLKILHYSNIRVLPEYYSNSTCNVTCSTNMFAKALISEFSTYLSVGITTLSDTSLVE
jgi:hypothetical protein